LQTVAIIANTGKPAAVAMAGRLLDWLTSRSIPVMLGGQTAGRLGRPELAINPGDDRWAEARLLLVLGGDGTLIRAAQMVAPWRIPVLGINMGHLGFLTELDGEDLFADLEAVLEGGFGVEERMMLSARVIRGGETVFSGEALNDAVVSKGPMARMVHLVVTVGETVVARYPADGVIVSTPTGSTAYSLSAGGPIAAPNLDVLLVTPICPHTISTRALVVSGQEQVTVEVVLTPGEVGLSLDGAEPFRLEQGDRVEVSRAFHVARLVRRKSYRFYDVLRQKLGETVR
jgi:NAD+ kinase